jgi:hypothetical protein
LPNSASLQPPIFSGHGQFFGASIELFGRKFGHLAPVLATLTRSYEEWVTRQVVEDGLTLRQVSGSEFQAAACWAMMLKHCKSHGMIGNIVMTYIDGMKEDTKRVLAEKNEKGTGNVHLSVFRMIKNLIVVDSQHRVSIVL